MSGGLAGSSTKFGGGRVVEVGTFKQSFHLLKVEAFVTDAPHGRHLYFVRFKRNELPHKRLECVVGRGVERIHCKVVDFCHRESVSWLEQSRQPDVI